MIPARRAPQKSFIKQVQVPAPMGGLNSVSSLAAMPKEDAVLLINMIGQEAGMRSRLGDVEHAYDLKDKITAGVVVTDPIRTVIPYYGTTSSENRLFAASRWGIYNCTASGPVGSPMIEFPSNSGEAGRGTYHAIVSTTGHYMAYADEVNGLYLYKETSHTWYKVAASDPGTGAPFITGLDPASAVFCTVWKHRLMLVERAAMNLWYLDLDAIQGAATKLPMAGKAKAGGYLVGAWSWTYDGGSGSDDRLVCVTSGGDVIIYEGTDPSIPGAFELKGVWNVGQVPSGRRIASEIGGDLAVISATGLVTLSKLVTGLVAPDRTQYVTAKVSNLFGRLVSDYGSLEGWAIRLHPADNCLIVTYPVASNLPTRQLVMSLGTKGWSLYRDLPIWSCDNFQGQFYFGTYDGRVLINDGYSAGITHTDGFGSPINFGGITAFSNLRSLKQKRVQLIRGNFSSEGRPPVYQVSARYRYDTAEPQGGFAVTAEAGAVWDAAVWDVDVWPSVNDYSNEQRVVGATGMGPEVALAFSGSTRTRVVLIGFDVIFDEGGIL